ncbi:MAG: hypothetical protein JJV98_10105 [Desulfosarcina sp.]|nr:hypothetical protein [Desulfobacterales bacterium]
MSDQIAKFRERVRFLKRPAFIVLILAGFILEFIIELPFRIMAIAGGGRRSA